MEFITLFYGSVQCMTFMVKFLLHLWLVILLHSWLMFITFMDVITFMGDTVVLSIALVGSDC